MVAIRTDLLEEIGVEEPTTFEEYYDDLLKIKEKHPDMYGFGTRNGTNYLVGSFAYALGTGGSRPLQRPEVCIMSRKAIPMYTDRLPKNSLVW